MSTEARIPYRVRGGEEVLRSEHVRCGFCYWTLVLEMEDGFKLQTPNGPLVKIEMDWCFRSETWPLHLSSVRSCHRADAWSVLSINSKEHWKPGFAPIFAAPAPEGEILAPPESPSPDDLTPYGRFVREHELDDESQLVVMLALAPSLRPDFFDRILQAVVPGAVTTGARWSARPAASRLIPTGDTALFLLAAMISTLARLARAVVRRNIRWFKRASSIWTNRWKATLP